MSSPSQAKRAMKSLALLWPRGTRRPRVGERRAKQVTIRPTVPALVVRRSELGRAVAPPIDACTLLSRPRRETNESGSELGSSSVIRSSRSAVGIPAVGCSRRSSMVVPSRSNALTVGNMKSGSATRLQVTRVPRSIAMRRVPGQGPIAAPELSRRPFEASRADDGAAKCPEGQGGATRSVHEAGPFCRGEPN